MNKPAISRQLSFMAIAMKDDTTHFKWSDQRKPSDPVGDLVDFAVVSEQSLDKHIGHWSGFLAQATEERDMTLVIAAHGEDGTFIGSDTRGSSSFEYHDGESKIFRVQNVYVGLAGSFRVAQLIRYNRKRFDDVAKPKDVFEFGMKLKKILQADTSKHPGVFTQEPVFELLLATPIGVFEMFSSLQFHKRERWAIGSGGHYGLGAFDSSRGKTSERIRQAILGAATVVPSVGGTPIVKKL